MERSDDSLQNSQSHDQQVVKVRFWRHRWFLVASGVIALLLFLAAFIGFIAVSIAKDLLAAKSAGSTAFQAFSNRDLAQTRQYLQEAKTNFDKAHQRFNQTRFLRYLPLIKGYWLDGDHLFKAGEYGFTAINQALDSLAPYADILGFTGAQTEQVAQSAEDRIIFLATTAEKLAPEIEKIATSLQAANHQISQINERHYPHSLFGKSVRPVILQLKNTFNQTTQSLSQFRPVLKLLPDLLGNPEPRRYLLLFQNDAELRPTGGFLTAYATMTVTKGKIEAGISQDIYTLDAKFDKKVPAPDPIRKYLPLVYYWNLRDMNLSPDFKVSMDTFTRYYRQVPGAPAVDAIIALDTQVPVRLLQVLGPVGVPGYGGKFSAEPEEKYGIPQVIYALENIITRPTYEIREGRKAILGPLMHSLLANMLNSPKSKWPEFFNIFTDSIREKHLLMYFFDDKKQKAVEALQAAGRIVDYDGDYLHLNDTNFAGAKSNLFVQPEVKQEISVNQDGSLHKKLTLTYRNPAPPSNCNLEAGELCLNGILRDWIRVYVPKDSQLISFKGSEVNATTSEDLGKTVFEGFFTIAPQSLKKLEIEYTTPPVIKDGQYRLLIQKQPGKKTIKHTLILNQDQLEEVDVSGDTEVVISLK